MRKYIFPFVPMSMKLYCITLFSFILPVLSTFPEVTTRNGKVSGFEDASTKGIPFYQFNSIPYAQPPLGDLRLKTAQPALPYEGVHNGSAPMPACAHYKILPHMKDKTVIYAGQEDCLVVSISVPKSVFDMKEKIPVLVYIHGGGFVSGSGNIYTGHEFLNERIVLVTLNYRLGTLGFLSTEDDVMPGNFGLSDQVLALQWIQDNIESFGGDPNLVTLFGLSAGGASVHFHMLSPMSKGLFKRAALQSGNLLSYWSSDTGNREVALQLGARLGCVVSTSIGKALSQELLECLQKVDAQQIIEAFEPFTKWSFMPFKFSPRMDGVSIPDYPEILLREGKHADVDIIIGHTLHDGAFVTNSLYSTEETRTAIEKNFAKIGPLSLGLQTEVRGEEAAQKVYDHYLNERKTTVEKADNVTQMFTDAAFAYPSVVTAEFHSENVKPRGKKVFYYQLEHKGLRSLNDVYEIFFGKHWVCHGDEAFYQFPFEAFGKAIRNDADSKIRDLFTKLWVNFATTGNPTPDMSLGFKWEPYTKDAPAYLSIDNPPAMVRDDVWKNMREFWKSLPTKSNELLFMKKNLPKTEL